MLITVRDAVRRLGVKPATLYAYVSRGLVRSAAVPDSREHRYYAEDIERLKRVRRSGRRAGAPPKAFDSFAPVLDSAICLVEDGRYYYRGIDAVRLADRASLEDAARLLWESEDAVSFQAAALPRELRKFVHNLPAWGPLERARAVLAQLAAHDIAALDVTAASVRRAGGRLVPAMAAALIGGIPIDAPIQRQLANAWGLGAADRPDSENGRTARRPCRAAAEQGSCHCGALLRTRSAARRECRAFPRRPDGRLDCPCDGAIRDRRYHPAASPLRRPVASFRPRMTGPG